MMWALFVQKKYFGKKINLFLWENGSKSLENSTKICPYPNIGKYSLLPLVSMIVSNLLKKSQKNSFNDVFRSRSMPMTFKLIEKNCPAKIFKKDNYCIFVVSILLRETYKFHCLILSKFWFKWKGIAR